MYALVGQMVATQVWRRHLAMVLDGLRSEAGWPIGVRSLEQDELIKVMRSGK